MVLVTISGSGMRDLFVDSNDCPPVQSSYLSFYIFWSRKASQKSISTVHINIIYCISHISARVESLSHPDSPTSTIRPHVHILVIVFRNNDNQAIVVHTLNVGWADWGGGYQDFIGVYGKVGYRGGGQDEDY